MLTVVQDQQEGATGEDVEQGLHGRPFASLAPAESAKDRIHYLVGAPSCRQLDELAHEPLASPHCRGQRVRSPCETCHTHRDR